MQTRYYETSNFIQHTGNVVDLEEYRRRLALAQQDSLARQPEETLWEEESWVEPEEAAPQLVVLPVPSRECRRVRRAWTLDTCASLAVIAMTLLFALRVML